MGRNSFILFIVFQLFILSFSSTKLFNLRSVSLMSVTLELVLLNKIYLYMVSDIGAGFAQQNVEADCCTDFHDKNHNN